MRIPAMAILSAATVLTAAPTQAQTYNPDYPVCLQVYGKEEATSDAAIPRWRSALSQPLASRPSASSIRILQARNARRDHTIGGIASSIIAASAARS